MYALMLSATCRSATARAAATASDAAGAELELVGDPVPHRHARHVGRQQVGRELDAAPRPVNRPGEGLRHRRLADPGHVFDEEMAFGEQAHEREAHRLPLALDDAF